MTGMAMGPTPGLGMSPTLPMTLSMMTAMMLPGAVPAITRRAREHGGALAVPTFAGTYLGTWALAAAALWLLYQPPGAVTTGALLVGAGLYELTPLKRACRRRCREQVSSGIRFGVYCFGSSIGLMLVLVGVDVMSVPLMIAIAGVVLAQKLLPPQPAIDVPLALAIIAVGIGIAAT
jgi:predicted metal-binding membrane protein